MVPATHLSLLAIDDDDGDLLLLRRMLERMEGWEIELETCTVVREGIERLVGESFDLLLLDYDLGAVDGVSLLRTLQASGNVPPAILWTGRRDEETFTRAREAGFAAVLRKDEVTPESFGQAIESALAAHRAS